MVAMVSLRLDMVVLHGLPLLRRRAKIESGADDPDQKQGAHDGADDKAGDGTTVQSGGEESSPLGAGTAVTVTVAGVCLAKTPASDASVFDVGVARSRCISGPDGKGLPGSPGRGCSGSSVPTTRGCRWQGGPGASVLSRVIVIYIVFFMHGPGLLSTEISRGFDQIPGTTTNTARPFLTLESNSPLAFSS